MKVLVSAASKHGATIEIAEAIARRLRDAGLEVECLSPSEVHDVSRFDAVVLGSAVYHGHWMKDAVDLVARLGKPMAALPVWLFSSGPIGKQPVDDQEPVDLGKIETVTAARQHRIFPGRLDRDRLGFSERAVMLAVRAAEGDYRDWAEIDAWAAEIESDLTQPAEHAS